jgi:hypothetical protein
VTSPPAPAWSVVIRGIHVTAGTHANCSGFARAVADFEPQADAAEGFTFVVALEERSGRFRDDELEAWCCEHIERGVRAELAEHFGAVLPAVRVILRRVLLHPVDSNERRNHQAGCMLAQQALQAIPISSGPG